MLPILLMFWYCFKLIFDFETIEVYYIYCSIVPVFHLGNSFDADEL